MVRIFPDLVDLEAINRRWPGVATYMYMYAAVFLGCGGGGETAMAGNAKPSDGDGDRCSAARTATA